MRVVYIRVEMLEVVVELETMSTFGAQDVGECTDLGI
jgi:hypothetical protein